MNRLWERIRDWVLLGVLVITSLVIMLTANDPMLRGLRARSLEATASIESMFAGLGRYVRALDENEVLRGQNIELSNQVALMRTAQAENQRLEAMLGLRDSLSFQVQAAKVIAKDITSERNFIIIDVGSDHGIKENMAVIDPSGIVGKVVLVGERYARVMTYLNTEFFTPANVLPAYSDGSLRWDGGRFDRLLLEHVVRSAAVSVGDQVVTNGYSTIYHPGYPIGVVDTLYAAPGMSTWTIHVRPHARLDNLSHVFVVTEPPSTYVDILTDPSPIR
ncbi:MAG: rod shape-determining protein MreC [Bacteroidetes bacterium]|nr:rod shape-determining protein MreC [Bacteroidota bacterium]MDA0873916.1 rod shape-determining protein MreC [Bacteroidota bacterium]